MDVDQLELDELRDLVQTLRAELGGFRQEQIAMAQQEKELEKGILEIQNYLKSHPTPAASPVLPTGNPPALAPHYTHILPSPPMPQKFSGNSREYKNFLTQCKLHFLNQPDMYNTDTSKILFVLMNLEGNALRWANPFIDRDHRMLRDYKEFSSMFAAMFECQREKEIQQTELIGYKQGHRETQEYVTKFQTLASSTDWPDSVLIKLFYKGLKEDIKDMLSNMVTLPKVFSEYTTLTIQIDQRLHERKKEKQEPANKRGKQEPAVKPQPMEVQVDLDCPDTEEPMQLGAFNRTIYDCDDAWHVKDRCPMRRDPNPLVSTHVPVTHIPLIQTRLEEKPQFRHIASVEQRGAHHVSVKEKRRLENLCFYCGDDQHFINQCHIRPPRMTHPVIRVIEEDKHWGVSCDACLAYNFQGKRYRCLECKDHDLCEQCYQKGVVTLDHSSSHQMRCISASAPKTLTPSGDKPKVLATQARPPATSKWIPLEDDSGSDSEFETPLQLGVLRDSPPPRHISVTSSPQINRILPNSSSPQPYTCSPSAIDQVDSLGTDSPIDEGSEWEDIPTKKRAKKSIRYRNP